MAGPNLYTTDDPEERNDSEGSHGSSVADAAEGGITRGNDANDESETNDGSEDHDDDDDDDEHDEPTAPDTFLPATLLVVLTIGVLSEDCDTLLNHAIDRGEVEESNLVAVPSRAECRASALMDLRPAPSPAASSLTNIPSSIERLRARASYNEAYKEANQQKADLGEKRLKMQEDELDIKRDEVKARQDEVKARQDEVKARQDEVKLVGLAALYEDLRRDLRDARDSGNADEVRSIKVEMQAVKEQRLNSITKI